MRVLVTGANGFIGAHLFAAIAGAGHEPVACVRDPDAFRRRWPESQAVACDLNVDTDPAIWRPRLSNVDAVVNAAGILQGGRGQDMEAIHHRAPVALFEACRESGVRRIVQISALGAEADAGTAYATTKKAADDHLIGMTGVEAVVVQPSLVFAKGSYGGTSLFRAMAALPFAMPVVGDGRQLFQPIHMDDVAAAVVALLEAGRPPPRLLKLAGPEPVAFRDILAAYRQWLGLRPAPVLATPQWLARVAAKLGDWTGIGPMNSTAYRMLNYGNTADPAPFMEATGIRPRSFREGLAGMPAQVQDRWHARLYFLKPLLRLSLALMWIVSGLVGLQDAVIERYGAAADLFGLGRGAGEAALYGLCGLDLAIGLALLFRWRVKAVGVAAFAVAAGYTIALSLVEPALWRDPFGPLLKNIPIAVALLVMVAIEDDR